jgi:hypothetical protein
MNGMWREHRVLLIILALLLAANTIFFFTYRVQYENRLRELDARLDQTRAQLDAAKNTRLLAEQQLAGYRKIEKDIRDIYDNEWSTQNARLTSFIAEVMRLAAKSEMVPRTYSFVGSASTKSGANRKGSESASEVAVSFNVEGTYEQVRRLINFLELSDQFIIIDQIALGAAGGETTDRLNMTVRVKTLFRDTPAAAGTARAANQEL